MNTSLRYSLEPASGSSRLARGLAVAAALALGALAVPSAPGISPPVPEQLLFAATTDGFPESGAIGPWTALAPTTATFVVQGGNPTVEKFGGVKWEKNLRSQFDCYRLVDTNLPPPPEGWMPTGYYTSAIPVSGASIVTIIKPIRNTTSDGWDSIVDIFYQRLVLGIRNNTGELLVWRNNVLFGSGGATIPDGQATVLSLIVQPDGAFKVYTNGTEFMNVTDTGRPMTQLNPDFTADWGSNPWFPHYIALGRNVPDGWPTYNGYFGDVFVYTNVLSDDDRHVLEADLNAKFLAPLVYHDITASAGPYGAINPSGVVSVVGGGDQTFTITPEVDYQIDTLLIDDAPVSVVTSYTFTAVATSHTIYVTFTNVPTYTITAFAGANGSISPSGDVAVIQGHNQSFTITPDPGYQIDQLTVDSVPVAVAPSYAFTNVSANHIIDVTFKPSLPFTITATATAGGTISPTGEVTVMGGDSQAFTIAADSGYRILDVVVDGVSQGPRTSTYTFSLVTSNHTIAASFTTISLNIPKTDKLLFSVLADDLPASGNTGPWPTYVPPAETLATIDAPTVETVGGVKWEKNIRQEPWSPGANCGFRQGQYLTPIACSGVTIVAACRPVYTPVGGEARGEIVDIFYDRLALAVHHNDGRIMVCRGYWNDWGPAIPDGQPTILSLVVQTDGSYKVYTNGVEAMSGGANGDWTSMSPGGAGYMKYVNVGRNDPDGWSAFNGNIGDVFVYLTALSDTDRAQVEAIEIAKYVPSTALPPDAPTNLVATAGDAQVDVVWDASAGATGYRVKRSLIGGGPYDLLTEVAGTNYTDTAVTNGTMYRYVVSATNAAGESVTNSAEASAMPRAATPATPEFPAGSFVMDRPTGIPTLTFSTTAGYQYRVTCVDDPVAGVWLPVLDPPGHPAPDGWGVPASGGLESVSDPGAASSRHRQYRIEAK